MKSEKSKRFFWLMFVGILIFAGILRLWQNFHWSSIFIEIKDKKLEVLVAKTYAQQYRGLGKRDDLGVYHGMIFMHATPNKYGIVMRDMRFPIDVVWINNGVVVDMAPNLPLQPDASEKQLHVYYPRKPANVILELPAGWTIENEVKIGDEVKVTQ